MGYESRVYVVDRHIHGNEIIFNYGERIAIFDLSDIGDPFPDLFTEQVDFMLFDTGDGDNHITEDCYGEPLKYAPLKKVKEYIAELTKHSNYRRLKPFLGLLEGIDETQWEEVVVVVHYGY